MRISPIVVCTRRNAGRGTGKPIAISGQTGWKSHPTGQFHHRKLCPLMPPSNRTADPVKQPLIPTMGCVFMASSSLVRFTGEEERHRADGEAKFLHLSFIKQMVSILQVHPVIKIQQPGSAAGFHIHTVMPVERVARCLPFATPSISPAVPS